ncbi:unnamed protein product [Clonostachys solani]|uniref:DNA-directed RNA polymerase n=1 Tax=Clonostachys solani TaxID=160281 RepID=A0A9N9ZH79_9HYPO|nr:unnamed protein product [Clonostachys solani]
MLLRQARHSLALNSRNGLSRLIQPASKLSPPFSLTPTLGRRYVVTSDARPRRRRLSDATHHLGGERSLATAVGDPFVDGLSFGQIPSPQIPFQSDPFQPFMLNRIDPSNPLILPEPALGPKLIGKMNKHGAPSEIQDLLPVFDACLRVGKLERAVVVLKRLNAHPSLSPEEHIILNNQYLRAALEQIRANPSQNLAEEIRKWYETQIRSTFPHTAETIACILKASLLSSRGPRLRRLVRRYMDMAPGEAGLKVLRMGDILSDQDLAVITDICPTYNLMADPESFEETFEDSSETSATVVLESTQISNEMSSYPEVQPTPQRGEGLNTLKSGMSLLEAWEGTDISTLPLADQREIQVQLERDAITSAISKWRHDNQHLSKIGISTTLTAGRVDGPSLKDHLGAWLEAIEQRLAQELSLVEVSEARETKSETDLARCIYGPLIHQAKLERLAAVTIISVLNASLLAGADTGLPVYALTRHIGRAAQEDIKHAQKEQKEKARRKRLVEWKKAAKAATASTPAAPSHDLQPMVEEHPESHSRLKDAIHQPWSPAVTTHVGAVLLKAFLDSAKIKVTIDHPTEGTISQYQPAFTHTQMIRKGKKIGSLLMNPELIQWMKNEPVGDFLAKHLPMVVEPKPWRRFDEGGYLHSKVNLVRVKPGDVEQKMYTNAAIKSGDLNQLCKGIDVLGKTAWRINQPVLDVMMEAWNSGKELANFPPLEPEIPIPPEPEQSEDPSIHRNWARAVKAAQNEISGLHSQRCFMNLQLEIARTFRNQPLYFPHNVDYRGRAYPIPAYLNHMGADHTRGILRFSKGKKLGERGLRWLKIHLANVYGLDKASFDDREAFAMENMEKVEDSVRNPLNGSRWWLEAGDPWQCLAACFELSAAYELPDPTEYVSHLPVQQDGTCNGLQHYAALGGDTWGAQQVNLEPGDKPADVYSAVADLVKQALAEDLANGDPHAKALDGKITRKVVKQTVMTNVYGVTFSGAKKQICKQIDALYPSLGEECGIQHLTLATYVARHVFTALATMFRGAHDIQYWLGEVGGRVCQALTSSQLDQIANAYSAGKPSNGAQSKGQAKKQLAELETNFRSTVVWTTPLRFPVVQPYRKSTVKEVKTSLQAITYTRTHQTDPVNRRKQLQGFPPNFIHSLDASHMLLSALKCDEQGLTFAAVHDSFWTHAADVDTMNSTLREAFVQIHEDDVIGRLAAEAKARHNGSLHLVRLDRKSPVAKKIVELRNSSKLSSVEELLLEHKRNTLRLSGTPWDLEAAEKIVTPSSVYQDMKATEEDLSVKQAVQEISLGRIPSNAASTDGEKEEDEALARDDDDADKSSTNHFATGPHFVPVWLPMTFPAIPKKGDFDVKRLRDSQYFFS